MTKYLFAYGALLLSSAGILEAQYPARLDGEWRGTRSERNPFNGQTFSISFSMEFRNDRTYLYVAKIGSLPILKVMGKWGLRPGSKASDTRFTHILTLQPIALGNQPTSEDLRLLQIANLPHVDASEQYLFYYDLAPAGALTLQDCEGGESWGLQRILR